MATGCLLSLSAIAQRDTTVTIKSADTTKAPQVKKFKIVRIKDNTIRPLNNTENRPVNNNTPTDSTGVKKDEE